MSYGGHLVRECRRRAGLTQRELAERLGTSQPAIARWESGGASPSLDRVVEAARACGLDIGLRVTRRDDHDLILAEESLRWPPAKRLASNVALVDFIDSARRRRGGVHADRVGDGDPAQVPFRPVEILGALVREGVECVLVGGLAAVLHGAPQSTGDVDVCARRSPANLRRIAAALARLGARLRVEGAPPVPLPEDVSGSRCLETISTTTRAGRLDIAFRPDGTRGYADLRRDAELMSIGRVGVRVASLADVIRSKAAAGRDKDLLVLNVLRELLRRSSG